MLYATLSLALRLILASVCDGSQCNAVDPSQLCGVHTASVRSITALHCIHRDRVGEGEGEDEGEGVLVLGPSHSTSRPDPSGNHLHRVISSRVSIPICRNRRLMALFR